MKGFQKVVCKVSAWALLLCSAMLMSFTSIADVQDDIVYFVVPDRYANGDTDNDLGGLTGDRSQTGYDPTDPRYFHGGDLKGLTSKLAYLRRMGINAIWITPPFKNAVTSGGSAGYHGYWMKDYTQIDPHWGTNEEMAAFVALAKRYRIKVYFDVVVNHTADVIRYEECHNADGSLRDGLSNCPYRSLEEIETNPYTPFIPAGEENSKVPAWLNDTQYYNNQGDSTFSGESSVNGDFFGLDDLNTRDQFVVDGMIDIFKGWIDQFGIDGFRVDTVKHVDAGLWRQWVPAIKAHAAAQGNDDFFIFGEVFDGNPGTLAHYTRDLGFPSVLDFGMYFAFRDVLTGGQGTNRLADILSQDDLYTGTNAHAGQLMNFVSNHDVGRIGHFIQNMPGISEDEKLQRAKLAQSMIFMTRGIPVIYYGDEQGFTGDGGDAEGREDMFASQVPEYNDNNLIGTTKTTADDNFDTRHPVYMHIQQLSRMYKSYPELRRGANFVRYSQDTPGVFAFSRYDADRKREALVLFNTSTDTHSIDLDVSGNAYAQAFPRGRGAVVPTDGKATFEIAPLSAVMWISDATITPSATVPQVTISSLQEGQTVADQVELIADLTDMDAGPIPLHQVHFAVSVDGGGFEPLGTDSVPQYRVQYDISGYPDGTELTFRAIADNYGIDNTSHQVTVTKGFIEGMRVIFRNDENADTPNIYYWNTTGNQPGVDWPGVPMTHLVGDYYEFQFDAGVTAANLIFNNNFGQTDNLYRTGDGCYIDGTWTDTCDLPGMEVFFQIPDGEEALWGTDINVYFWDATPQAGVDWPGVPMELVSEGIYRFQFDNNVLAANLIFNGNGRQTENLYREKGGCYINNSQWADACEADSEQPGMTVYFRRPLDWDVPNVHYWYDGGASTWPGVEMDALGDDWYRLQLPDGVTAANMVINDKTGGDGNQTGDLYREGDGCYDLATDSWTDSCATPGYTVYFRKPNDWDNAYAYFWATHPEDVANVGWPGEGMTELGADTDPELGTWFTYQLPSGVKGSNIIFNNAGAPQTTDLSRTGDGCYTLTDGWSDTCEVPAPGMTVYFYKPEGFGDNINIHFWNVDGSPGWPGAPMQTIGDGWYSYTFEQGVTQANMLFHDNNGNQTTDLQRADGGCFGQYGDFWRKSCVVPTGVEVEIANRAAHLLTADTMAWQVSDNRAEDFRLYYSATASIATEDGAIAGEDGYIALTETGDLDAGLQAQDPHLASWTSFTLDDASQTADLLKGQLIAAAMDGSGNLLEATAVQFARALDDLYAYNGPLGVSYDAGAPSVTVWAPTAQAIELVLYDAEGDQVSRHAADSVAEGAYTFNGEAGWDKLYYLFDVTVFHPFSGAIERYEVTDPYAVSLSENSQLSQFLDLEGDASLKPGGWDGVVKSLPEHQDISLYEGHVRDFSENDQSVPAVHRGKYMAFTHNGVDGAELSNGMAHLIGLQQAGLSHFHLLPVFDISSIDENVDNRVDLSNPFSRLCAMSSDTAVQSRCADEGETPIRDVLTAMKENDPTTADIQAIVDAMNELDSFNWGYDPYHFNAPEGSYATATDGQIRVLEFREMVKALDEVDLNVVMDVVYNHTSASGLWSNSVLDRMVPGYYHRLNPISGGVENSTCCDNTATEHEMMEKLMVDTLVSWAKYFKIDSFRFDLMGHIPKSSMLAVKAALDTLTTATDGVEGDKIYLYGEGWDFGEVAGNQRFEQATQFNMAGTGIGTFNDRLRSAARGGNFTDSGRNQGWTSGNELFSNGYTTGGGLADQADRIRIGLAGNLQDYPFEDNGGSVNTGSNYGGVGYALDPQESVNYVDKHDNESLWDNTQAKLPDSMSADDRVRVHMLSNALINYGLGVPFYQMGTDLLRSKSLDRNTYNSGDWFNAVDFTMQDNNWASGLPLAQDNDSRWPTMADIINNGNISVTPAHIAEANAIFRNQLQVRYSTPLMRLADAQQVIDRVAFHNTGAGQLPGLIAMSISDGVCAGNDLDTNYDGVVLMFNADDQELSFDIPELPDLELHPVLSGGSDEVVKTASVSGATYTIPAHTAAVFVKPQGASQGEFPCNPQAAVENQPGMTVYFHNTDNWPEVRIHYWDTSPVAASTDWPGAELNVIGEGWYSYQFPNGVTAANVIFNNNNNGIQTNNLYREGDGCYVWQDADFTDSCVLPGIKVYFKKAVDSDWSDDIHIHYWNSSPAPGTDWPGEQTTNLGDGWFFFQMPEGVRSTNLIFNDSDTGTGGQTTDLSRNKDGCYSFENGWLDIGHPECSPPDGP